MGGLLWAVRNGIVAALVATFVAGVVSQNRGLAVRVGLVTGLGTLAASLLTAGDGAPDPEGF